jgi:hypothetical protein
MEYLLLMACKVVLGPVAGRVLADYQQGAADRIEQLISRLVTRGAPHAEEVPPAPAGSEGIAARGDAPPIVDVPPAPAGGEGVAPTDAEIVTDFEEHPASTERLREALEGILGFTLSGPDAFGGTDAWFVSAYESILWRAAVTAGLEDRPIAVTGALQGPEWVTVCVPHQHQQAGRVIDPATIWRAPTPQNRRRPGVGAPVDFFVRRVEHAGQAATEAAELNSQFIEEREFDPGPAGPSKGAWHRVDGLSRGWVLLQWDDALQEHIQQRRHTVVPVPLDIRPPKLGECPEDWQLLMAIPDPAAGMKALSDGIDAYAERSKAVVAAARAVLDRGLQD